MTKVFILNGGETFTNSLGEYRLSVRGEPGDTVTIVAHDGYDGKGHSDNSSGSVRAVLHPSVIEVDVVLDENSPI